jgi:hypothetical protein
VRTTEGLEPIEKIQPGDLVLSQDVTTGELGFQPILRVHHNRPNQTVRLRLSDDQTLFPSIYHRFWRSGKGWALARDLNSGDVLRTRGSIVKVIAVEPGPTQPLYNLDVAKNQTFFVGTGDVLVHDNTLPPARQTAFDAPPRFRLASKGGD